MLKGKMRMWISYLSDLKVYYCLPWKCSQYSTNAAAAAAFQSGFYWLKCMYGSLQGSHTWQSCIFCLSVKCLLSLGQIFSSSGMAISPIPFMEEAEQAAASGQVQPAAATTTARSQANPPARMITLTEHLKGSGPSPRLKRHRSHKDGKTSEPDPKKAVPSNAPLPTSSSVSTAATTFGRLAQDLISDQDVKDWSSSALEANKKALSRAATAVYYRQLSKAREMRALSQTNLKLDSKVKSLQSKVNEHGQAKVNLVNNYNQKMLNLNAARDKALKEQKEAHDLATEAWKKKKDSLEERVLELEGSVSAMNEGHEAALADARNLGARNFMKIFIKKVPDFDWAELWVRAQLGMPRN
ncbi:uncharacterized protein LOC141724922 isoform X3 [Apium graveolens]|uniref:uncharacterized protein LOC141724922 isoform X3 n=1 Tax=Apium graveolens TaxID=4045 RepID=UPI003D78DDE7